MAGALAVPLLEDEFVWTNKSNSIVPVVALGDAKPSSTKLHRVIGSPHSCGILKPSENNADRYSPGCRADTFLHLCQSFRVLIQYLRK